MSTPTTSEIRTIQVGLAARGMVYTQQGATPLTAVNGAPVDSASGIDALDSTDKPAVIATLWCVPGASVTSYGVRVWGYALKPDGTGAWAVLGDLAFAGKSTGFKEMFPAGGEQRLYIELTDIVDSGSDGVEIYIGKAQG